MAEQSHRPQARRSFLRFAAAGVAVLLGGCQIVPIEAEARREPPPVPQPQRVPEPAPMPIVPAAETQNRVAVLVPLTGPNAGVGSSIANAANLALADTGNGRIRIAVYDTAKGAQLAAQQALAAGNGLILGPLLAEDVRAVAPLARRANVPVISFSNDMGVAGDGVYIMGFTPGQSIERVVSYARAQGLQRFAGLIPQGDYGRRSSQAFGTAVAQAGGRVVGTQSFDRTPASLRSAAIRLNAQAPYDAVLIADNGQIAMSAAATIRTGPSNRARILGTELWKSETRLARSVPMRGAWFASAPDAMFNQLQVRYRARYGRTPYRLASLGYDAVLLAVRVASDWPVGRPFPAGELRNPGGFAGIDGAFRFGSDGVADRQLEVVQVNAGGFSTISPAASGFGR